MNRKLFFLILTTLISCNSLKQGSFEIYEHEKKVGDIFRLKNFQIEKYDSTTVTAKLDWESSKQLILSGIENNPNGIDTIRFLNKYKKIKNKTFLLVGTPLNLTVDYQYSSIIKKKSSKIEREYLLILKKLNKKLKENR